MDFHTYFPYDNFRDQQEEVIKKIYKALNKKNNVLLVAPNGTGKTVDTLSAALPIAMSEDLKIVYLCRTHQQSKRVIDEIKKINYTLANKGESSGTLEPLRISATSMRGRSEMCLNRTIKKLKGSPTDIMNVCADLRKNRNCSHYNQMIKNKTMMNNSIKQMANESIDAQELIEFCKQQQYCPYFYTKLLLKNVRVIVCSYQWIFNPSIRENFLEGAEIDLENTIIIMDECHNLPDMAADIDSFKLTQYSTRQCLKDLQLYNATYPLINAIKAWQEILDFFAKRVKDEEIELDSHAVLKQFMKKAGIKTKMALDEWIKDLSEYGTAIYDEKVSSGGNPIDFCGVVVDFMYKFTEILDDSRYFLVAAPNSRKTREKSANIEIICLDPRELTENIYNACYASISCSGTINAESFSKLVGLDKVGKSYTTIEVQSPFPKRHLKVLVTENLNTKAVNRVDSVYKRMNKVISDVIFNTPANVGVFCASYGVLKGLVDNGLRELIKFSGKNFYIEKPENSASDNTEMITNYKSDASGKGAVLLGVSGGRNSEGEDFPGNYMNAVVVAGFPFQRPTPRIQAKIKYYDSIFDRKGRLFAYIIPAIQKSNQAAGRPIRKLNDKGVIVLMDDRFKRMSSLLSKWLRDNAELVPEDNNVIASELKTFFK